MSLPIRHLPMVQNWDCHVCGTCCKEYQVTVSDEERRRIDEELHHNVGTDVRHLEHLGRGTEARALVKRASGDPRLTPHARRATRTPSPYPTSIVSWSRPFAPPPPPAPGAIQVPWNIRGEKVDTVIEWLTQRGVPRENIVIDVQARERIPEIFDRFKPDQVVSSDPVEGAWIPPNGRVVLGVHGP